MEVGFHRFTVHEKDYQNSPENDDESPPSPRFHDIKATSPSSKKRSRRLTKKRVVHIPIKEVKRSRFKAETNTPPSDSWTWRKYGQKPIKGSPYPRGYYRCSSSKGCPARKQVERSRTDPTMLMVTYSCEHNHPWPASRNTNHDHYHRYTPSSPPTTDEPPNSNIIDDKLEEEEETLVQSRQSEHQQKFTSLEVGSCGPFKPPVQTRHCQPELESKPQQKLTILEVGSCGSIFSATIDPYGWFSDLESTSTMFESPLMVRDPAEDGDMATIFSIKDDEESFFADLDELPECTTVFRRKEVARAENHHRSLAPCCGTTG